MKLHTLMDLRGSIPCFIRITEGKRHDVKILDELVLEPAAFYVMDRGYIDFRRLYLFQQDRAFFVIRARRNLDYRRRSSHRVKKSSGLRCDQTTVLKGLKSSREYPEALRRISYYDATTGKGFVFLTNNFKLPPLTVAMLYKRRWQVELFFKWIKQHLRIKAFYGASENAVKTQIWIAISVYVLVAIVKKELNLDRSLGEILQILRVTLFERSPIYQSLTASYDQYDLEDPYNQLSLFNF